MTECTNRFGWANGRPLNTTGNPDPQYERAQCWECGGWAELEDGPAPYGLPGTVQVLEPHERPEKL